MALILSLEMILSHGCTGLKGNSEFTRGPAAYLGNGTLFYNLTKTCFDGRMHREYES